MSGILATIAYTILMCSVLVSASRPVPLLLALAAAMLGSCTFGWTCAASGSSSSTPGTAHCCRLSLFACLGALGAVALDRARGGNRAVRLGLVAAALVAVELIIRKHGFADVFSKPLGRFETVRTIVTMKDGARIEKDIPYYNLRPILVPMIAWLIGSPVLGSGPGAAIAGPLRRNLLSLGRRSLDVYILHLSLLAVLVVLGRQAPPECRVAGGRGRLAVIAICWLWVTARDRYPRFPRFWSKN